MWDKRSIFVHNHINRHLMNIILPFLWFKEKGTFVGCPKIGKITPDTIEWANKVIAERKMK